MYIISEKKIKVYTLHMNSESLKLFVCYSMPYPLVGSCLPFNKLHWNHLKTLEANVVKSFFAVLSNLSLKVL